jgi:predicted RNA binding protein YcfA (HicA-like mRNA interferase family)
MSRTPRITGKDTLAALLKAGMVQSHVRGSRHYLKWPKGVTLVCIPDYAVHKYFVESRLFEAIALLTYDMIEVASYLLLISRQTYLGACNNPAFSSFFIIDLDHYAEDLTHKYLYNEKSSLPALFAENSAQTAQARTL